MNLIELLRMNKRLSGITAWQSNQAHTVSPLQKKSIETVPYNTLFKNTLLRWGIFCADVC